MERVWFSVIRLIVTGRRSEDVSTRQPTWLRQGEENRDDGYCGIDYRRARR